jgi:hypothetical protein
MLCRTAEPVPPSCLLALGAAPRMLLQSRLMAASLPLAPATRLHLPAVLCCAVDEKPWSHRYSEENLAYKEECDFWWVES